MNNLYLSLEHQCSINANAYIYKISKITNKQNKKTMNIRKWEYLYSNDCDLKYNSLSTRKTYKYCVSKFLNYFHAEAEPKSIPTPRIKEWLLAFPTLNTRKQMLCSVNSFYCLSVGMTKKIKSIPYPKKVKRLPIVIDTAFLSDTINEIGNIKHKAILMVAYSCALRVSEVINLKIKDIDSQRMIVFISNAKGGKDRIVKLSDHLLKTLRVYFTAFKPKEYLFNGQFTNQYSSSSCNKLVKKYIGVDYHFH